MLALTRHQPVDTPLKIGFGHRIEVSEKDFQRISDAFFTDLQGKFT
jgi:hypothetical protein